MRRNFLLIVFAALLVILISCNSNPTEAPITPGRRDYTWTVDTLNMPMNVISAIWGSSPNDVWAVGAGGDDNDRLQHYDGSNWAPYTKEPIYCTGNTIFGFSQNDVWMGGGDGAIWHFDGNTWGKNFTFSVGGANMIDITDLWGNTPNDLYACGTLIFGKWSVTDNSNGYLQSFLLHYDGITWHEVARGKNNYQFLSIRKENKITYIFALSLSSISSDQDIITFYKLNSQNLEEIYSNSRNKIIYGNQHVIDGKVYFLIDQDIYRYILGKFVKQFSINNSNFGFQFYGRSEKDVFLRMRDGLAHYNGADIQYMYNFPLNIVSIMNEPAIFEKEIFFALWDATHVKNMVLHGKIKE